MRPGNRRNMCRVPTIIAARRIRFNEAAGIHRRKRTGINSSLSREILTGLRGVTGDPYVGRGSVGMKCYYIP